MKDMQPRLRLLDEQDLDRHPDIEVEPLRLTDTIERQAGDSFALTGRGYTLLVLGACGVLVLLALAQWAFGLTDDIREARNASAVMLEKCR